jgi:hypothetical protein
MCFRRPFLRKLRLIQLKAKTMLHVDILPPDIRILMKSPAPIWRLFLSLPAATKYINDRVRELL